MTTGVQVRTPCRLHFGMFSFGQRGRAQFGGVGMMVEPPSVTVKIRPADCFTVRGSLGDRAREFVERAVSRWELGSLPACEIEVESPANHIGLGVGSQLGLAVAAGLRRLLQLADVAVEELAGAAGRGARSAVGTYGFELGGLIVDAGKESGETMGRLWRRAALPDDWRFVLFCRADACGLAGTSEAGAFARLPPVPAEVTDELWGITKEQMLPAVEVEDCGSFGEAVYRFGRLAGECFAAVQGGPFANAEIARLVESIREFGVPGVGQSSWGPTVFAVTDSDDGAQRLAEWVRGQPGGETYGITIARPSNIGAVIEEAAPG
jgi:beta-ribofuranosylaminobenzene 5'-phosphate synthase